MNLPLFNLLPVTTRAPTRRDEVIGSNQRKVTITTEEELLCALVDERCQGPIHSACRDKIEKDTTYREWQEAMPCLDVLPELKRYQPDSKIMFDLRGVSTEIQQFGRYLSKGQVLYRGANVTAGKDYTSDKPTSVSLNPCVARWHATSKGGCISILKIDEDSAIKAYVYDIRDGNSLAHEIEIVLDESLEYKYDREFTTGEGTVLIWDVST